MIVNRRVISLSRTSRLRLFAPAYGKVCTFELLPAVVANRMRAFGRAPFEQLVYGLLWTAKVSTHHGIVFGRAIDVYIHMQERLLKGR